VQGGNAVHRRGPDAADVVTDRRLFDLDDIGAEVGEVHAERVRSEERHLEHSHTLEQRQPAHSREATVPRMDLGLRGRVAVVTGASQGIGREIALHLAAEGADLVLCARRQDALDGVAEEAHASDVKTLVVAADVTNPSTAADVRNAATERFGRLDILVNNAGKGHSIALDTLSQQDWDDAFALNFFSAVRLSQACVPVMREQGFGRVINIGSRVGREPDPYFAPYGAAKAALMNFTKNLANAYSADGVTANTVLPGLVRSEAVDEAARRSAQATGKSVEEVMAATLRKRPIPAGRLGEPVDVAALVTFVASEQAGWLTGSCLTIDGGIVRSAF
jgi:3-oxoacyl-[acyl-carrier protein] reductase